MHDFLSKLWLLFKKNNLNLMRNIDSSSKEMLYLPTKYTAYFHQRIASVV